MKKKLLTLLLLITFGGYWAYATHIVGGELQMTFLSNTGTNATYRITLNMYWDRVSNVY